MEGLVFIVLFGPLMLAGIGISLGMGAAVPMVVFAGVMWLGTRARFPQSAVQGVVVLTQVATFMLGRKVLNTVEWQERGDVLALVGGGMRLAAIPFCMAIAASIVLVLFNKDERLWRRVAEGIREQKAARPG